MPPSILGAALADITWKRTGALLRKLFQILMDAPEGLQAAVALAKVAEGETLSEYEAGTYSTGDRRFEKIIRWATVDLVKAGWLLKHKGTWSITDAGRAAYKAYPDPETFYSEAVKLYRKWKQGQTPETPSTPATVSEANGDEVEKSNRVTYEQAEEQAWREIENYVKGMDPYKFQELVAALLKAMGYYQSWISPPGKDGGLDIIAHPDPLGTRSPRIKVQVKRTEQKITVDGVRAFLSLIEDDDAGLFVATGGFTSEAHSLTRTSRRKIRLIDLEGLFDLWVEFYHKLDDRAQERLPISPIYFITPRG